MEIAVPSNRGSTPYCAYATPHSTGYVENQPYDDDDDDEGSTTQNAEFDIPMDEFESSFGAAQLEDTVWEGVEDGSNDNNDIDDDDDDSSDSSGAPSEYPSTKPLTGFGQPPFSIYEDDDNGVKRRG